MREIPPSQLAGMAINVLERTAMVLAETMQKPDAAPAASHFARIEFGGPAPGSLTLGASEGFLREVAAGFLGIEPDEVDMREHAPDALKELTNMVGGSVLVALSGERGDYFLGLPALTQGEGAAPMTACTLSTELGALRLSLEGPAFAKAA